MSVLFAVYSPFSFCLFFCKGSSIRSSLSIDQKEFYCCFFRLHTIHSQTGFLFLFPLVPVNPIIYPHLLLDDWNPNSDTQFKQLDDSCPPKSYSLSPKCNAPVKIFRYLAALIVEKGQASLHPLCLRTTSVIKEY